jgi:signal peptidase I
MSARADKAEAKRPEPEAPASRESLLVAAADNGPRAFYAAAGYGRLLGILGAAAAIAVFAQVQLRHQSYLVGSLAVFFALFALSMVTSATPWGVRSRARAEAKGLRRSALRLLRKHRVRLTPAQAQEVEQGIFAVDAALDRKEGLPALGARWQLDAALEKHLAFARKSAAREYTESIGGAILIALVVRAFVLEPFHIPSGSMIPTLLVGDFIFVNKMAYGLRVPFSDPARTHKLLEAAPHRGDVVVFINPQRPDIDYVKRVIGLPGDRIEVKDNVLFVNGEEQHRTDVGTFTYLDHSEYTDADLEVVAHEYIEDLGNRRHPILVRADGGLGHSGGSWVVAPGRVFMMGDNRDNSADSRVDGGIGQIPFSYIKGRASLIWISFGGSHGIRFERFFRGVK